MELKGRFNCKWSLCNNYTWDFFEAIAISFPDIKFKANCLTPMSIVGINKPVIWRE
jgi:hypothetical protein